jgi:hypothetical protein
MQESRKFLPLGFIASRKEERKKKGVKTAHYLHSRQGLRGEAVE